MIKGKIVLAPFPFTDLSSTKVRPVLCLSEHIGSHNQIIVAFISSKVEKDAVDTDIVLDTESDWFSQTGLKVKSVLKLHKLVTTERAFIRQKLGELPAFILKDVDEKLKILFGIDQNGIGYGDYSKEREELLKNETMETVMARIKARRKEQ
ncbi:MAG: type II toxin-antitoxin system PemK/MazF family toxin [Spirochaetaceae bacterium]|jgi:mRNA interferase MazF|nr:type II toxin-antitoxin system PemK/MazF family toxin [Spirochaetaceae bacterium]